MNIKAFLQKIAGSFQPAADAIQKWDMPPELKKKVNQIWVNLPVKMQEAIWKMIKNIAEKYGDEIAQAILDSVLNALKRVTNE